VASDLLATDVRVTEDLVGRLRLALRSRTWVTLPEDIAEAANRLERIADWVRKLNDGEASYERFFLEVEDICHD